MAEQTADLIADVVAQYGDLAAVGGRFLAAVAVVYLVGRLTVVPAARWLLDRSELKPSLAAASGKLIHGIVVLVAVVAGAGAAGFQSALAGSALLVGALTLAVGYAAQHMLANFVSGVFLIQDPNLNVGDRIEWGDKAGTVRDIGFRVTRLRTGTNESVLIPNARLTEDAVVNKTANDPVCLAASFTVDYERDVDEVSAVLCEAGSDLDFVLEQPEPLTRVTDMQPYAVEITLYSWMPRTRRREYLSCLADVVEAVHRACQREDIDLSTTSQHLVGGAVAVEDGDEIPDAPG